jgi:hypothetical protein
VTIEGEVVFSVLGFMLWFVLWHDDMRDDMMPLFGLGHEAFVGWDWLHDYILFL